MLKKLRRRFVCFTMAIVSVMLSVIFLTVYSFTSQNLEEESLRMMESLAEDPFQLGRPSRNAEQVRLPYFAVRISPFGDVVAVGGGYFDLTDEDYLNELIDAAVNTGVRTGVLRDYGLRFLRTDSLGIHSLVFADISSERATLHHLIRTCAGIGVGSLLAFFALSVLLARWAVRPVEQAWKQQRQFVADASHELKTPLTVILTNAELLQSGEYDEASRKRFSDNILTMSRQMRGLVESLLELARVDNGAVQNTTEELDLSALTAEALLPFEPLYYEQGLQIHTQIEPGLKTKGSAGHLKQVVEILLDNAMKYSRPGTDVELCLKKQGPHCLLTVTSRGETLSKEELRDIFKRFYRADKARSMNHSYGLGLAIAESIVTEHGGRIWAESEEGVNRFYVELPGA